MRFMRWSWDQFEATPVDVINRICQTAQDEHEKREADRQLHELRNKFGNRRF